jgi:HK97 family phage prohead protease
MLNPQLCDRIRRRHEMPEDSKVGVMSTVIKNVDVDRGQRLVKGIITTTQVDRDGDVVLPFGVDTSYFDEVKSVFWQHDYNQLPIGTNRTIHKKSTGLYATTFIRRGPFEDELLNAIEDGAVRGHSIGFRIVKMRPPDKAEQALYGKDCQNVIEQCILNEYSITPNPCNPGALIDSVVKGRVSRENAVRMGLPESARRKFWDTGTVRSVVLDLEVVEVE